MKTKVAFLLLLAALTLFAHHSAAVYDMQHPITLEGTVLKLEWTNPHAYIFLEVKNDKGEKTDWAVEIDSPNFLKHNGWTRNTVKVGDSIKCTGGQARTGAKTMRCTIVTLPDGSQLRS
jgi:hypothetical protein